MSRRPHRRYVWLVAGLGAVLTWVWAVGAAPAGGESSHPDYGRDLSVAGSLGIGPTMDVTVQGRWAYTIGEEKLHTIDASGPARPRVIGSLSGLGNTRQIVVANDVAYVSSRSDGLYVVSVKDRAAPKLLCHYDSIEWATGLAISGDVLFIACRNFGVELVDVSNPQHPRHLSTVRTGEAQSVVVRSGWLYAGVWGSSEVVAVDVHNPRQPKIVSRSRLDGYGDGVDVRGNFLYAATGHHSRQPHRKEGDPGYGSGHGLEIFDVSDPAKPQFLSRVKFPKIYVIGNDMWGVTVAGNHAFVADTYNGVFVVDVSNPRQPVVIAHHQLPEVASRKLPGFIGGLALVQDHIYAAGGWTDLHVIAAPGLARPPVQEPDHPPVIPPPEQDVTTRYRAYRPEGQVYAVALTNDIAVAACGSAGIHVVRLWPAIERLVVHATEDFATDVALLGDRVYVAEGAGGLSIWQMSPRDQLTLLGRYRARGQRVRHVAVPAPGHYALVQMGESRLHIVDVSNPAAPKLALKDTQFGLLYGHQIMDGLVNDRYAAVFWHVSGLHWYDLGGPKPVYAGQGQTGRFSMMDGLVAMGDQVLATRRGGYVIWRREQRCSLDELPLHRVNGQSVSGKPTLFNRRLYVAHRATGAVNVLDITNPDSPRLIESFTMSGNPGQIIATSRGFVLPDGYHGLLVFDSAPTQKQP